METKNVYQAINAVQAELAVTGIAKDRNNTTQGAGYKFRGIDDVYNAVAPLLAKHGLVILPRMLTRLCEERQSKSGGALFYVTVEAEFDFVSASDGSKHTVRTFGEAMDSGDKATNKSMSAAYKYAAFQTFAIPTEGNPDADAQTHAVESRYTAIEAAADKALELNEKGDETGAFGELYDIVMGDDNADKLYLWGYLKPPGDKPGSSPQSRLRNTLKTYADVERGMATKRTAFTAIELASQG